MGPVTPSTSPKKKPLPQLQPEYCKACLRCIPSCNKDCIVAGDTINPKTGVMPVILDTTNCSGCGLCIDACPEPYGMRTLAPANTVVADGDLGDPVEHGAKRRPLAPANDIPAELIPLAPTEPLVIKGTYASAIGALLAGCRHVFGYPITPSTEGAELMAKILPRIDGAFVQAASEVAAVNMMYGCGGAGLPVMTFTSSPGFSLMLEGISYMIGAEVPGVFVNIMRGGPGLGNIGPEQADIKLACRGLGHGNSHAIVLAPSTPQEMLDLTFEAFELSFRYKNPVVLLGDGYLGQMTGVVKLPQAMVKPGLPGWAVWGDAEHRGNLICSIMLAESDLEKHNIYLNEKYAEIGRREQRSESYLCDDAEVLLVACNTPARMAKGAVQALRAKGIKAGLFRPMTIWPFPIEALSKHLPHVKRLIVVEASPGQLEDELRLAVSHAELPLPRVEHVQRYGGVLPQQEEIVRKVMAGAEVRS